MSEVKHITDNTFQKEVLESKVPVLVDFWASWCGPCRMMAPVLDELATKMGDKMVVSKVNVDENPNISSKFNIRSIPTMVIFKDGKPFSTHIGFMPLEAISSEVEKAL